MRKMDKILIEAVIRLYRKELKELESQRDYLGSPNLPLGTSIVDRWERLDLEIKEVEATLVELKKLG